MLVNEINTQLVVIGGGLAGVCTALAAARNGAEVVLVQDRSVLGGNASSEVRMHIVGADCHGRRPGARESGIIEELKLEDSARNPQRSYAQWDLLLYEKVLAEPRIQLLLDSDCVGCETQMGEKGRKIVAVKVVRNSTEETFLIRGDFFADCSGDGRLGMEAGADFTTGREGQADFNESLAQPAADRLTLGASILFTARRHDSPRKFVGPAWIRRFEKKDFIHRPIKSYEYGYWWIEWGGHLDVIRNSATIRHELMRITLGIWDYIKNSGDHPGSANWVLEWVSPIIGKRESRRFLGPYVLNEKDILDGRVFDDQVAYGGWWIDLHPPRGIDAVDEPPCDQVHFPHLYSIPLRALYSRNVDNLFFAGRNISATHVAFASTRVMATCAAMGQAIGTAAALALGKSGRRICAAFDAGSLGELQQVLLKDDAFLLNLRNQDARDLALSATVQASDEKPADQAGNVIDGIARQLCSHFGDWADGLSHRWQSVTLPAWIELSWPRTLAIHEIHLTFDSGFQRELILSASEHASRHVLRGPQPELVRDYKILVDGLLVLEVRDNFLRKRIHRLKQAVHGRVLRIHVDASNGTPDARLFEIRVYGAR